MRRSHLVLGGLSLLATLAGHACSGAGGGGTFVVVQMNRAGGGDPIARIELTLAIGDKQKTRTLTGGGQGIAFPTSASWELVTVKAGAATADALAYDAADNLVASASTSGVAEEGKTVTLTLTFGGGGGVGGAGGAGGQPVGGAGGGSSEQPMLAADMTEIDFPDTGVGTPAPAQAVTIRNAGRAPTGTVAVVVGGLDSGEFSASGDCAGTILAAGATCTAMVRWTPQSPGGKRATLSVTASPGGTANVALTGTAIQGGQLQLSTDTVAFPATPVNAPSESSVTVTNVGGVATGPLQIAFNPRGVAFSQAQKGGDCVGGQTVLAPNQSCPVYLRFAPTATGAQEASLQVSANPGGTVMAKLIGEGVPAAALMGDVSGHDFQGVEVGAIAGPVKWNVSNTSTTQATGVLSLLNTNPQEFTVNNQCPQILGPGASCLVEVSFRPSAGGARSGNLTLSGTPGGTIGYSARGGGQFRLTVRTSGLGSVASNDGLVACANGNACWALYDAGRSVGLTATTTNGSNHFFQGFSGGGCGAGGNPARACQVTVNAATTVTATFAPMQANLIFVSSSQPGTKLGSEAAYDAECNRLATAAGLNSEAGNAYVAWVSGTTKATGRLGSSARGWVRLDGRPFADSQASLLANQRVWNPVRFDEWGQERWSGGVMTGTFFDGSAASTGANGGTCQGWTLDAGDYFVGGFGHMGPFAWTDRSGFACSPQARVYCMGRTRSSVVAPAPVAGKRIWLTNTPYVVGAMTPDQKCSIEKPPGGVTAAALIAYTSRPASAALNMNTLYVRMDGVPIGLGSEIVAAAQAGGILGSGLWQSVDGTYRDIPNGRVWTGSADLTSLGSDAYTCANWTSGSKDRSGIQGGAFASSSWFFNFTNDRCDGGLYYTDGNGNLVQIMPSGTYGHLYCVEQ